MWWNSLLAQNTQFTYKTILHSSVHCWAWTKPIWSNLPGHQGQYKETPPGPKSVTITQLLSTSEPPHITAAWGHGRIGSKGPWLHQVSGAFLETAWSLSCWQNWAANIMLNLGKTDLRYRLTRYNLGCILRKVSFDRSHKFTSSQEMEQAPWRLHSLSTRCRNGQLLQWPDPTWRAFWSGPKLTLLLPM